MCVFIVYFMYDFIIIIIIIIIIRPFYTIEMLAGDGVTPLLRRDNAQYALLSRPTSFTIKTIEWFRRKRL